ncbi:integral membrane sensor signal transduction histidine kinase [Clostridium sp. DL-VIII]|uniref:sensor histidine kinase n=1 Tax=Clostridium sp. DL-VIII TaxID=641107 RepID=UPI00023B08A1|nr:HAMP domain-containing sensor histidine kinase [Clostridium sp. DL-VIII]EHJ01705.1 integral membrane sensor signal transduction histidine kinase [Clostridium sp. DL-VIII]
MRFSIRYKFAIGLLVIFCFAFNFMTFFISNIVMKNNQNIIKGELLSSQRDLNIYCKQFLAINNIKPNEDDFNMHVNFIGTAISLKVNNRIVLYRNDGTLLLDTDYGKGDIYSDIGDSIDDGLEDLKSAIKGKSAYKILKIDKTYKVIFSEPLFTEGNTLGILRYEKDYTELFETGNDLIFKIKIFMFSTFLILFIFSFLLSTKIIIPIIKLNRSTKEISDGNFEANVFIGSNDEIGELGESFNIMKDKIKEQIETIKKDRDDLIKIEGHRKVFFDNVTHEMKTPLTIIDGYSQIILDEGSSDKKLIKKAASKIKKESNKLHQMIADILNMSKLESKRERRVKEKLDMSLVIKNICEDMGVKAKKYEITIEKTLEEEVYILAERHDVWRMLINIIDNSIKYGNVKSIVRINMFVEDGYCNIIVADEGKGISEEAIEKIFEPFYREDKDSLNMIQGNGLGLSIVKAIVDKYKGLINIESKDNNGTTVYIKLPMYLQVGNKLIK